MLTVGRGRPRPDLKWNLALPQFSSEESKFFSPSILVAPIEEVDFLMC